MSEDIRVKICGVTRAADVAAAVEAKAAYLGFVFFPKSPRYLAPDAAAALAVTVPAGIVKVALTVDADDQTLDRLVQTVPLDMLQLHGHESAARVREVKARYGLPVMKAVSIASTEDLPALTEYGRVADQLLVDTKAPKGAALPGGNGVAFDWSLIAGRRWPVPWMLAGGLTAETVAKAIACTGAQQVDVSSGVELSPGAKQPELIRGFVAATRANAA